VLRIVALNRMLINSDGIQNLVFICIGKKCKFAGKIQGRNLQITVCVKNTQFDVQIKKPAITQG
jgi:hypothetical protein